MHESPSTIKLTPVKDILAYFLEYQSASPLKRGSIENSRGHRRVCVKLVSRLLGLSFSRVNHWGKGIELCEAPRERILELNIVYLQSLLKKKDKQIKELESKLDRSTRKLA